MLSPLHLDWDMKRVAFETRPVQRQTTGRGGQRLATVPAPTDLQVGGAAGNPLGLQSLRRKSDAKRIAAKSCSASWPDSSTCRIHPPQPRRAAKYQTRRQHVIPPAKSRAHGAGNGQFVRSVNDSAKNPKKKNRRQCRRKCDGRKPCVLLEWRGT